MIYFNNVKAYVSSLTDQALYSHFQIANLKKIVHFYFFPSNMKKENYSSIKCWK